MLLLKTNEICYSLIQGCILYICHPPNPGGRDKGKKMKEKELLFYSQVLSPTENGVKPFFWGGGNTIFFIPEGKWERGKEK